MKKLNLSIIAAVFVFFAQAQSEKPIETLFGNPKIYSVSGFGSFMLEFSQLEKSFATSNGGGGGVLINQAFYLGGYGLGLASEHFIDTAKLIYKDKNKVSFSHGGFWIGYQHNSYRLVHFNISSKLGWGQISLFDKVYDLDPFSRVANDNIFVITPQVEAEINMARWFKINVGIGYRTVTGITLSQFYNQSNYSSPIASLSFMFGGFGKKTEQN